MAWLSLLRGCAMDKALQECSRTINSDIATAVRNGRINGGPFAEYTDNAATLFRGFSVLIDLIQVGELARDSDDDAEVEKALTPYEAGTLISMMRATSDVMSRRAEELASWAKTRMEEGA